MEINADFEQIATAHTARMDWVDSPMAGVSRRMLDRIGDEIARATSIVRYAEGSNFSPHVHSGGEEFLVLKGVFQDEHGDFPVGTYIRNPIGTAHKPGSEPGCEIFVKLWQFGDAEKDILRIDTEKLTLDALPGTPGVNYSLLYEDARETVQIQQWDVGAEPVAGDPGGAEILVIRGAIHYNDETFSQHEWIRLPCNTSVTMKAGNEGARIWMKTRHLTEIITPTSS